MRSSVMNWSPLVALRALITNYFLVILISAIAALLIRFFVVEAFLIPTDFMAPTLIPGDHIFVNKLAYKMGETTPSRGDIIVFAFPNDPKREYIKRVIGIPGDRVEIKNGEVFLNSQSTRINSTQEQIGGTQYGVTWDTVPLEERKMIEVTIPPGKLFVLGDNRGKGQDSRVWGFLNQEVILGKAWMIWFSIGRETGSAKVRWERLAKAIHE